MLKSFFGSKESAVYAWVMLAFLLVITWYNVQILVAYNLWNKEFYDAIQTLIYTNGYICHMADTEIYIPLA